MPSHGKHPSDLLQTSPMPQSSRIYQPCVSLKPSTICLNTGQPHPSSKCLALLLSLQPALGSPNLSVHCCHKHTARISMDWRPHPYFATLLCVAFKILNSYHLDKPPLLNPASIPSQSFLPSPIDVYCAPLPYPSELLGLSATFFLPPGTHH